MAAQSSSGDERVTPTGATTSDGRSMLEIARIAGFYLAVLVTIGVFVSVLGDLLLFAFTGWTAGGAAVLGPHRFHVVVAAALLGTALLGVVIQLYRPVDKLVGVLGFLTVVSIYAAIFAAIGSQDLVIALLFGGLGVVVAVLHPSSESIRRHRLVERFSPIVLGLIAVAAIPLVLYVVDQFTLQLTGDPTSEHVVFGHYADMATLAGSILVLALIAALAPVGWRIAAVGAGLLALVWGVASVAFPAQESSGGLMWGALAVIWAVAFVAATEYAHRADLTGDLSGPEAPRPA